MLRKLAPFLVTPRSKAPRTIEAVRVSARETDGSRGNSLTADACNDRVGWSANNELPFRIGHCLLQASINTLLNRVGISAKPINSFEELRKSASSMFVAIFEAMFQVRTGDLCCFDFVPGFTQ